MPKRGLRIGRACFYNITGQTERKESVFDVMQLSPPPKHSPTKHRHLQTFSHSSECGASSFSTEPTPRGHQVTSERRHPADSVKWNRISNFILLWCG